MTIQKPKKKKKSFCKVESLSKMVLKMLDGSTITRYSLLGQDRKSKFAGVVQLEIHSIKEFGGQWKTRLIYDNNTKELNKKAIFHPNTGEVEEKIV